MSDLFQLIHSDFSRLIGSLDDVPGDLIGDFTFLSTRIERASMDVSWIKLAWSFETLPRHVSSSDFPGCVIACSVRLCRSIGQVHTVTELTAGAEPGSSLSPSILLVGLWSSFRFSQNAHSKGNLVEKSFEIVFMMEPCVRLGSNSESKKPSLLYIFVKIGSKTRFMTE